MVEFNLTAWQPTLMDRVVMYAWYRWLRWKDRMIARLGGYDRVAVARLLAHARDVVVEQEMLNDGLIMSGPIGKLKGSICHVDPELGHIYGYQQTYARKRKAA